MSCQFFGDIVKLTELLGCFVHIPGTMELQRQFNNKRRNAIVLETGTQVLRL
jgi:hypothetical protein